MNIQITLTLNERRCHKCGRWWAVEEGFEGTCPMCAREKISQAIREVDAHKKSISALQGVITKQRRKS